MRARVREAEELTMAKKAALQIVTANHLLEGHSVFLSADGWTTDHRRARVAASAEDAAALEQTGKVDEDANYVVGVYMVDVVLDDSGHPEPIHYREKLRVRARPSFWPDEPSTRPAALSAAA
jgi:hypothetical protein